MTLELNLTLPRTGLFQESSRTREVRKLFGFSRKSPPRMLGQVRLDFLPGQITLVVGPSGSGKSTLLNAVARQLGARALRADQADLSGPQSVVDRLPLPLQDSLPLLCACGLGEARVMVSRPNQLSDGERHRFKLALGIAQSMTPLGASMKTSPDREREGVASAMETGVLVMDEFCATLDRLTARLLCHSVRRLVDHRRLTLLAATTHQDVLEALDPDVVAFKSFGPGVEVHQRSRGEPRACIETRLDEPRASASD